MEKGNGACLRIAMQHGDAPVAILTALSHPVSATCDVGRNESNAGRRVRCVVLVTSKEVLRGDDAGVLEQQLNI